MLLNMSNSVTMRDSKYSPGIWNLDSPDLGTPLPIPVFGGDYIRPGGSMGPQQFIRVPGALQRIKEGNRLFGFIIFTCSNCLKDHTYWIYIKYGTGGWYAEETRGIDLVALSKRIPDIAKDEDAALGDLVPIKKRVQIQ
jgi:hypothetical protein